MSEQKRKARRERRRKARRESRELVLIVFSRFCFIFWMGISVEVFYHGSLLHSWDQRPCTNPQRGKNQQKSMAIYRELILIVISQVCFIFLMGVSAKLCTIGRWATAGTRLCTIPNRGKENSRRA
jgi:hypothetical protein